MNPNPAELVEARRQIMVEIRACQERLAASPFAGRAELLLGLAKVALSKVGSDPIKSRDGLLQCVALLLSVIEIEETA